MSPSQPQSKAPIAGGRCTLVQEVCAELALHVILSFAYNHQARHCCTSVKAYFSILQLIKCAGVHDFHDIGADITSLGAADKECLACVGVVNKLKLCILGDYQLLCTHSIVRCDSTHNSFCFNLLIMLMDRGYKPKLPKARGGLGWLYPTLTNILPKIYKVPILKKKIKKKNLGEIH